MTPLKVHQVQPKPVQSKADKPAQEEKPWPTKGKTVSKLHRRYLGNGEWELTESTWTGPPDTVRVIKVAPWVVLKEHVQLWYKSLLGSNGTGDLE